MERTVHSQVPKVSDVEIHVSTVVTPAGTFGDIREFILSTNSYGRGITFPASQEIVESIKKGLDVGFTFTS